MSPNGDRRQERAPQCSHRNLQHYSILFTMAATPKPKSRRYDSGALQPQILSLSSFPGSRAMAHPAGFYDGGVSVAPP